MAAKKKEPKILKPVAIQRKTAKPAKPLKAPRPVAIQRKPAAKAAKVQTVRVATRPAFASESLAHMALIDGGIPDAIAFAAITALIVGEAHGDHGVTVETLGECLQASVQVRQHALEAGAPVGEAVRAGFALAAAVVKRVLEEK
jgi:hypothetical protein